MRLIPTEPMPVIAKSTTTANVNRSQPAAAPANKAVAVAAPPLKEPRLKQPPPADYPGDDDGLGALYELNEQANTATAAPDRPRCPSCRSAMDENAVLCTNCGYDTRSGKSLTTDKAPVLNYASPQARKNKGRGPVDRMAPQGSFILGLVLASVFGVVCAIVWIVVMFVTGYEIGILATVVGWTVGLGMQIGQKGYSKQGGIAAATIAVLAIAGPKLLLMALVLALLPGKNAAEVGLAFFHPLTILFIVLGIGAAYRTANGSSS
jgi:hypothetical protein